MPADRSRNSKRGVAEGNQLVWTNPIESTSSSSFSFATNLTPITFNDPHSSQQEPLFPAFSGSSGPRNASHNKRKPDNHIPRPPNAFILFRSSFIKSQHVSSEVETNHSTLSKIIGLTWQNLPDAERQVWHAKAKARLDEHKKKFPEYAFRPVHAKSRATGEKEKRKVREVGVKDLKRCAKIAELLVEGKKGSDLDAAIQEFDKTHVPEVVTRFEEPITASAYRRSSSAPPPEVASSRGGFLVDPPTPRKPKVRASSSKPHTPIPLQRCASLQTFSDFSFPTKTEYPASPTSFEHLDSPVYDSYSYDGSVDPFAMPPHVGVYSSSPISPHAHDHFSSPIYSPSPSYSTSPSANSLTYDDAQMPPLVDIPPGFPESFSLSFQYYPDAPYAEKHFQPPYTGNTCMPHSVLDLPSCGTGTYYPSGHGTLAPMPQENFFNPPPPNPKYHQSEHNDYLTEAFSAAPGFGTLSM